MTTRRTTHAVRIVRTTETASLGPLEVAVLQALADAHDGTATATWLAAYTNISRQSVVNILTFLMAHGLAARAGEQPTPRGRSILFAATVPGRAVVSATPGPTTLAEIARLAADARAFADRVDAVLATLHQSAA